MKKILIVLLITLIVIQQDAMAAFTATTVWDVKSTATASDVNGGGFDPSNANMATDLACTSATGNAPVCTSASYNFDNTRDSNAYLFVQSGTNFTPGWYKISSASGNAATVDATIGHTVSTVYAVNTAAGIATTASPTGGVWSIDYSQQAAAGVAYTDMVIGGTTTQYTSVLNPVGVNVIGNVINVASGSGCTVQLVEISSVSTITATVDKSIGTAASTCTAKLGGAFVTIAKAAAQVVAGNTAWVHATGTYSIAANVAMSTSGTTGIPIQYMGYTTYRGDGGQATVQASTGMTGMFTVTGNFNRVRNFILDANSQTTTTCVNDSTGTNLIAANLKCTAFTARGFFLQSTNYRVSNLWATAGSGCTVGFDVTSNGSVWWSRASANACTGFRNNGGTTVFFNNTISDNNTGGSSDGYTLLNPVAFNGIVSYKNGRDGIRASTNAASFDLLAVTNSILFGDAGTEINIAGVASNWAKFGALSIDYNCIGGAGTFYSGVLGGPHTVSPGTNNTTNDPFTAGGSNDFSLNNTANAGATCRAAGFPGALQSGGTGYLDTGVLQHQATGGASAYGGVN